MKKIVAFVVFVATLIGLSFSARIGGVMDTITPVAGNIYELQAGSTVWGMQAAMSEKVGTFILVRDNLVMFVWPIGRGWGFAVLDAAARSPVTDFFRVARNGNFVDCKTAADFITALQENKWEIVGASEVPLAVKNALIGPSAWITSIAGSLTTFLVVPVGTLDIPEGFKKVEG